MSQGGHRIGFPFVGSAKADRTTRETDDRWAWVRECRVIIGDSTTVFAHLVTLCGTYPADTHFFAAQCVVARVYGGVNNAQSRWKLGFVAASLGARWTP